MHYRPPFTGILAILLAAFVPFALAAELSVEETAVPENVTDAIKTTLESKVMTIKSENSVVWEFWLRKDIPVVTAAGKKDGTLNDVKELTLIGVARVGKGQRDFKDVEIDEGVYTLRMGKIPQDGDHMGVAPHPFFAVLVKADLDTEVDFSASHDEMVDKSMEDRKAHHPAILSLQPAEAVQGDLPQIGDGENEWKLLYLSLSGKSADGTVTVKAGLVFEGFGEI
ncbi:MAG: hypothetical protein AMXMBFR84_22710 [Candidatus Hydrogenedentota bacterium]